MYVHPLSWWTVNMWKPEQKGVVESILMFKSEKSIKTIALRMRNMNSLFASVSALSVWLDGYNESMPKCLGTSYNYFWGVPGFDSALLYWIWRCNNLSGPPPHQDVMEGGMEKGVVTCQFLPPLCITRQPTTWAPVEMVWGFLPEGDNHAVTKVN